MRRSTPHPIASAVLAVVLVVSGSSCSSEDPSEAEDMTTTTSSASETTTDPGPPPGAVVTGLRELEPGDCFDPIDDPLAAERAVMAVDCAGPHAHEVYDVISYDGEGAGRGTPYPGEITVQNWAEQACFDRFEAFVGVRWTVSELDIEVWWPSAESWARADRSVVCTVMSDTGEKLNGSQRGVNR